MTKIIKICVVFIAAISIFLTGCGDKEKTEVRSAKDLEHAVIGVQLGTISDIYVTDLIKDKPNASIKRFIANPDAIKAVLRGDVDCLVLDYEPAKAFAKQHSNLRVLNEPFAKDFYAAMVAKGNRNLLTKVNEVIDELEKDGSLKKIIDSYINGDTEVYQYIPKTITGRELVVATDASFPPYEYRENGKIVGIDIEIAKAIADHMGMVVKIEDMEFDSIITAVVTHKVDIAISGLSVTEERKEKVDFSREYVENTQSILVRDGPVDPKIFD